MKTKDLIESLSSEIQETKYTSPYSLFAKWVIFFIAFTLVVLAIKGIREDINTKIFETPFIIEMVLSLFVSFTACFIAIKLAIPDKNRGKLNFLIPIIPVFIMGYVILQNGDINLEALQKSLKSNHLEITILLIIYTIPLALFCFHLINKLRPTSLEINGLMAILSSVSGAHFIVRITEIAENIAPVFVWCYSPIIVFSILGVYFGQKFLKW